MAPAAVDPGRIGLGHRRRAEVRHRVDRGRTRRATRPPVAVEKGDRLLDVARRTPPARARRRPGSSTPRVRIRSFSAQAPGMAMRLVGGMWVARLHTTSWPATAPRHRVGVEQLRPHRSRAELRSRAARVVAARQRAHVVSGRRRAAAPPAGRGHRVAPATKTFTVGGPSHSMHVTDGTRSTRRACRVATRNVCPLGFGVRHIRRDVARCGRSCLLSDVTNRVFSPDSRCGEADRPPKKRVSLSASAR